MAMQLTCPHCNEPIILNQPKPGLPIRCPGCSAQVPVPWVNPEPEEIIEPAAAGDWWHDHANQDHDYGPPLRVVKPKWHRRMNLRGVALAGAAVLLLAAGMWAGMVWQGRTVQPVTVFAPPPPPVAVVALSLVEPDIRPLDEPAVAVPEDEVVMAPLDEPPAVVEAPVVQNPPPAQPERIQVRRLRLQSDEDLRKQLLNMPVVQLDTPGSSKRSFTIQSMPARTGSPFHFTPTVLASWPDLQGLPFRMGADCQLGKEPAETMQGLSRQMRGILAESMRNDRLDPRMDPDMIRQKIGAIYAKLDFHKEMAVPCLMQMLQPENTPIRKVLVDQLATIKRPRATDGLVRLALFDLSDAIRAEAIQELAKRPAEEYRLQLLEALRYPWAPAAEHAAEALVALNDKAAVPTLQRLVNEPDPEAAYYDAAKKHWMVTEVVRINHLSNCMLCHAPSRATTDLVRGRIPSPGQPLPPMTQYYEDTTGPFVRADVTYLKQDFSVFQPVEQHGPWPAMQRFDYLVRTRVETAQEYIQRQQRRAGPSYPQRDAVLYALRVLSQ